MAPNYKEVPCPSCNRIVRSTDKYCIFCGKKLNPGQINQQQSQSSAKNQIPEKERNELEQEVNNDLNTMNQRLQTNKNTPGSKAALSPFVPATPFLGEAGEDKTDDKKNTDFDAASSDSDLNLDIPPEIQDQLEAKMNLAVIEDKKGRLRKKLTELSKELESERYEQDFEFAEQINLKLNALKSIKDDLTKEEDPWRKKLGERFKVDELEDIVEEKHKQLIELKRSFKLHNVKKDVYEQLKIEYTEKYQQSIQELNNLRMNIIRWLSHEKTEKNKLETRIRVIQGRQKSKEITKEEFETEKTELEKQIDKVEQRIKILDLYAKEKPKKYF